MEQKSNKTVKILLALSLVVNIALIIFVITLNNQNDEKAQKIDELTGVVSTKDSEIVAKTQELETMSQDLERIRQERENLGLQNDSLDKQIANLNSFITQLKKTNKLDSKKRKELEELVAKLREEITTKDYEIAQLKTANDSLNTSVSNLTHEKRRLGDSLDLTSKELAYASILKAEGVKVTALKENGKEMDQEEYKHSKIDRIKITFVLADNKAAKKNLKKFYVTLVPPSGTPFSDPINGGGIINLADGTEAQYTLSQDLSFDNSNQKLSFILSKGFNYIPGQYKIHVYSEGHKIGEGGFNVK
ncbi:hypothetical protein MYP_3502 [Sporocytophaga myxococcoides]|uniref:Uncharacterized protein n=1 Tax=Sporocytophaga myxococcoides TaxID=153721 RepID=A0A098LJN9_9BACT|nr:hypothetical protein [Sporocytophaga myxococcoides]GAL86273.1 hypothetical protein MYP_3502 [Sporocytophaga myxococcoides]